MSLAFAVTTLHTARRTVGAGGGGRRRGPPAEERGACCLGGEGQAAFAWPCVYDLASNATEQPPNIFHLLLLFARTYDVAQR